MRRIGIITLGIAASLLSMTAMAQKTTDMGKGGGGSPHARTEWTIDGAHLSIEYGRPFLKGRPEAQMMPPGQPWRTGADAATVAEGSSGWFASSVWQSASRVLRRRLARKP